MNIENWTCPLPLQDYPNIVIGHGGGGKLGAELIEHMFLPFFRNDALENLGDSSVLTVPPGRLAFSTDSFVVKPLFFPGGSIGDLAINGTVNDISMSGARPLFLSAGFIIEEGFPMSSLAQIVQRMSQAAEKAGILVVTGDTKVVEKGHGDGCYINTAGIGIMPDGIRIGPTMAQPGDVVILSGTIGDHGMAIMSMRESLEFETTIESDCAALNDLVAAMLETSHDIHVLRDPTRGGVASSLNEIAGQSKVGITIDENHVPVKPDVHAACELLGIDPIYVANEGKLIAIVSPQCADAVLARMKSHPLGADAQIIGTVTDKHPGMLVAKTGIGGTRVIPMQIGEQLPRIC